MATQASCRLAWTNGAGKTPADSIDLVHPQGTCESYSLADPARTHVPDSELVARVITAPDGFDNDEILTSKLTSIYAKGLSCIRTGAPDAEILAVISALLAGDGAQSLIGAAVLPAAEIRACGSPAKHFCVYDTDADLAGAQLSKHADVTGTYERSMSGAAWKGEQRRRRGALKAIFSARLVFANDPDQLLVELRRLGI